MGLTLCVQRTTARLTIALTYVLGILPWLGLSTCVRGVREQMSQSEGGGVHCSRGMGLTRGRMLFAGSWVDWRVLGGHGIRALRHQQQVMFENVLRSI